MGIVNRTASIGIGLVRALTAKSRQLSSFPNGSRPAGRRIQQRGMLTPRLVASVLAVAIATGTGLGLMYADQPASQPPSAMAMAVGESTASDITVDSTVAVTDEEAVDWARERFREAQLTLPPIRLSFHRDSDPCEGAQGGHRIEDGASRVLICVAELGRTRQLKVKRTLLHEFAHAWDAHFLTEETRAAFMELHDLKGWGFDVPYEERGSEHAAETITWGLMDEPLLFGSFASPTPWETQHSGYLTLTGQKPPHGYVWSLFAAGRNVYAHTPAQLEVVKTAWEQSEELRRRSERIEVRFHRTAESCESATVSSQLIDDRLHIQACPGPEPDLAAALLNELTSG